MSCEQNNNNVIPIHFKSVMCQATLCTYYMRRATCTADYLELDSNGVCIHFPTRVVAKNNQPLDVEHEKK